MSLASISSTGSQQEKIEAYGKYVDKLVEEKNLNGLLEFVKHSMLTSHSL
jgi:hypothetical protein